MSTLTMQYPDTLASFSDNTQKSFDWRYQTYDHGLHNGCTEKAIYWTGIVKLSEIIDNQTEYPLYYINQQHLLSKDRFLVREEDGAASGQGADVLYDFSSIMYFLLESKRAGATYFKLFLEEKVNSRGQHSVSVLSTKSSSDRCLQAPGICIFKEKLQQDPSSKKALVEFLSYYFPSEIDDTVERICLLNNNDSYRWLK